MTKPDLAENSADAVRRFASRLARHGAPQRVQAHLDGRDGMARLCAVEAAFAALWPPGTARELVWLTRSPGAQADVLRLRAFSADGGLLDDAAFELAGAD